MPKGRVAEREIRCQACGTRFVTDKVGKAAMYCRSSACDEQRAAARRNLTPEQVEAARAERERRAAASAEAKAERQRAAEARRVERARKEAQRAAARREKDAERLRDRIAKDTPRAQALVERANSERARARDALRNLHALRCDLARLEDRDPPAPPAELAPVRPAVADAPPQQPPAPAARARPAVSSPLAATVEDLVGAVLRRQADAMEGASEPTVGRQHVKAAVVRLAGAQGAGPTAEACKALAVEVVAWYLHLRHSAREMKAAA